MQVQSQPSGILPGEPCKWSAVDGQAPKRRRQRGFTLIELMIAVAVAVALLVIAVPSFRNITLSNRLNAVAKDLVDAISVARMEAIKRNASAQFCSNSASGNTSDTLGAACGTQAGAVWAMSNGTPDQVLAGPFSLAPSIHVNGDLAALRFGAQGQARMVGAAAPFNDVVVADICTSQMSSGNHRVIRMTAGSILTTTTGSGDCPSP